MQCLLITWPPNLPQIAAGHLRFKLQRCNGSLDPFSSKKNFEMTRPEKNFQTLLLIFLPIKQIYNTTTSHCHFLSKLKPYYSLFLSISDKSIYRAN